jgi:hypothetical protein
MREPEHSQGAGILLLPIFDHFIGSAIFRQRFRLYEQRFVLICECDIPLGVLWSVDLDHPRHMLQTTEFLQEGR